MLAPDKGMEPQVPESQVPEPGSVSHAAAPLAGSEDHSEGEYQAVQSQRLTSLGHSSEGSCQAPPSHVQVGPRATATYDARGVLVQYQNSQSAHSCDIVLHSAEHNAIYSAS